MIVLNMIVKNEAHIIERCLDSVRPLINAAVIVDTGSTDDTPKVIRKWCDKNNVHHFGRTRPWKNFAHNRNDALDYAREKVLDPQAQVLFIDADEVLELVVDNRPIPACDMLLARVRNGNLSYLRNFMCKLHEPFYWKGAVHEYLTNDAPHTRAEMPGVVINVNHDGARSQNTYKFAEDAALLLVEYAKQPNDARTLFYLAQSLRDFGDAELARVFYLRRAALHDGWEEERWYAQYRAALLAPTAGERRAELLATYEARPWRAEPLTALARESGHTLAMVYLQRVALLPVPTIDILFVDVSCYRDGWQFADLVMHHAFYSGFDKDMALARSITADNAPPAVAARIEANRKFYEPKEQNNAD